MSGVRSDSAAIWLAALTAGINTAFSFVGLFLVDKIGRRPLLLGSLVGKTIYTTKVVLLKVFTLRQPQYYLLV